jgi:lactobin A/cerein 7B family class IIb bacteriocin
VRAGNTSLRADQASDCLKNQRCLNGVSVFPTELETLPFWRNIMEELNVTELQEVSGGIIPVLIGLNVVIWGAVAVKKLL